MNRPLALTLTLVFVLVLAATPTGCTGRQLPEAGQSTPPPPPMTTFPGGADPRSHDAISVGPARIFSSDFLYFHGDARLPDGTVLESQFYESGKAVPWWPADRAILVRSGVWEIKVPLGVEGAPPRLKTGPSYQFKVRLDADPSVQAVFYFDLGGPPAPEPWWQQMFHFIGGLFDDLFHGRLWRAPPPRTPDSQIDRDVAIILAAKDVPPDVIKEASKSADLNEGVWRVIFFLPHGSVSKDQLEWPEGPDTSFENHGRLPSGSFSLLTLFISGTSGAVLFRQASDGIIVGPLEGHTELPDNRVPPWTNIASGMGGLLVGGTVVWLVMRLKRRPRRQRSSTTNAGDE